MTIRFRKAAEVGKPLIIRAAIDSARARIIQTSGEVLDAAGDLLSTASGKYVPLPPARHEAFVATLVDEPATAAAAALLRNS